MAGVKRRLFTMMSAISLAMCIVVGVLGLRSYSTGVSIGFAVLDRQCDFVVWHGRVMVTIWEPEALALPRLPRGWTFKDSRPWWRRHIDLEWHPSTAYGLLGPWALQGSPLYWDLPWWPIYFVTGAMPAFWLFHCFRRRPGISTNACATCGYDLRATPLRCPECGTETAKSVHLRLIERRDAESLR